MGDEDWGVPPTSSYLVSVQRKQGFENPGVQSGCKGLVLTQTSSLVAHKLLDAELVVASSRCDPQIKP